MQCTKFLRFVKVSFILVVIALISFGGATRPAQSRSLAVATGGENDLQRIPAGLTPEEWDQIARAITEAYEQQAYLKASIPEAGDRFGTSVAISGDTLVVGARGEGDDEGAAYVFVRSGSDWSLQDRLEASNGEIGDRFGTSVAISGDTVVVGAVWEDSDGSSEDNEAADGAGAAYVFVRSGTAWSQQGYLKASNAGEGDEFGISVAISGDTVVVGANREDSDATGGDNNGATHAGAAYVFVRSGTDWTPQGRLKATNAEEYDLFGTSVAISGETLVVGAYVEDGDGSDEENNSALGAGAAYVFVRSESAWTQQAYLKASIPEAGDQFGYSVAISGDTLVVGASGEDGDGSDEENNSALGAGAAYVFVRSGSAWSQQDYLKASNAEADDLFGYSVAISGETVVVGALGEDGNGSGEADDSAEDAGAAYVFVRSGSAWTLQDYLKASNAEAGDNFGYSVAISGETVVVGAHLEDGDGSGETDNSTAGAGAAYVFVRNVVYYYFPIFVR